MHDMMGIWRSEADFVELIPSSPFYANAWDVTQVSGLQDLMNHLAKSPAMVV